jgi:circadian clock protein KaiC
MSAYDNLEPVEKLPSGVEGFDTLAMGGLPEKRVTLIAGSSGSGKTLLASEIVYRRAKQFNSAALYITFEERPADIIRNVKRLGWNFAELIDEKLLDFIDASNDPEIVDEAGPYNLSGLVTQIKQTVKAIDAKVVVLDSIGALFHQFGAAHVVRREVFRLAEVLKDLNVTGIMTAERLQEFGPISRHGVEEFASDNVIILRNVLEQERCRRTVQVLKMRGDTHYKGEFPFTITESGISVIALAAYELKQTSSFDRVSSGNDEIDAMTKGGFFRDSIILVSGPTGGGKTLMATTFASAACRNNERVLFLAFEESHDQLLRNAEGWNVEFERWEKDGLLRILCQYPEGMGVEDHLVTVRRHLEDYRPNRLIVDSISAIERVANIRNFREFIIGLTSIAKHHDVCSLFTSTTPRLSGGDSVTEAHISTITDAILLLRYVEINGHLRRGMSMIKMRGSQHEKVVREFQIDSNGMHVGEPFRNVHNIILGIPYTQGVPERDRLMDMFGDEGGAPS